MAAADQESIVPSVQAPGLPTPHARNRAFWIGLVVMVLSLVSGLSTYLILTGLTPIVPRNEVVRWVLLINIILIAAMIAVIAWQVGGLWRAWVDKAAGARLHIRIVALFSVIVFLIVDAFVLLYEPRARAGGRCRHRARLRGGPVRTRRLRRRSALGRRGSDGGVRRRRDWP